MDIAQLIATTKSFVGNKTIKLSKVIVYITESPKVLIAKEFSKKQNA